MQVRHVFTKSETPYIKWILLMPWISKEARASTYKANHTNSIRDFVTV